jgi:putative FmdB family regulatory protein
MVNLEFFLNSVATKFNPFAFTLSVQEIDMPIYEYKCEACGRTFEALVFGSEKPCCPSCSSAEICKLMSACGFVSKAKGGETVSRSAGSSACSGCSATSCATCGH